MMPLTQGPSNVDYLSIVELAGDEASREQIERLCHRYYWAGPYCRGKDVLEVACGTGQGLGYLAGVSKTLWAGDICKPMLERAKSHYGNRLHLKEFDAEALPFESNSFDVIILFEAIYYLREARRFVAECRRVLRPEGKVLIATANKDLLDFNPSPLSVTYYGIRELEGLFASEGFSTRFFGFAGIASWPLKQRMLRWMKWLAVSLGLIPRTMEAKKFLKRLIFGRLVPMPAEIRAGMFAYTPPQPIRGGETDKIHKVIYCLASLS